VAWALALAPIFLFIPAFLLAGMGPCAFSHPSVMLVALLLFIGTELVAMRWFIKAARSAEKVIGAFFGIGTALVLLAISATLEFFFLVDYLSDL